MNSTHLIGSYWVLNALPIWATAVILYMMTIGVIFILRDRCEGLFYNTSYSAMLGDGALLVVVLMAAGILQRGAQIPIWFDTASFDHIVAAGLGITLGFTWFMRDRPEQWGDRYHHLVIAPLLCYLVLTLLPVILKNGTKMEIVATICLIALWAVLVVYDWVTHRLDQRNYYKLGGYLYLIKGSINMKRWEKEQDTI